MNKQKRPCSADELISQLSQADTMRDVRACHKQVWDDAINDPSNDDTDRAELKAGTIRPARSSTFCNKLANYAAECFDFEKWLTDRFQKPFVVTHGDFWRLFVQYLRVKPDEVEFAYNLVLDTLALELRYAIGTCIEIGSVGRVVMRRGKDGGRSTHWRRGGLEQPIKIWKHGEFSVELLTSDANPGGGFSQAGSDKLWVRIAARASQDALSEMSTQIGRVFPLIVCEVARCKTHELDKDRLEKSRWLIRHALSCYFNDHAAATMERRIRNALDLLMESELNHNLSVKLALCMSSIEAILGSDDDRSIVGTVAQNVATTFEPDKSKRLDAENFVRDLYKCRSNVLHGFDIGDMEGREGAAHECRTLACDVVRWALGQSAAHQGFFGEPLSRQKVLKELKDAKYVKPRGIGSADAQSRIYWNKTLEVRHTVYFVE
jgi:hypothetical protein